MRKPGETGGQTQLPYGQVSDKLAAVQRRDTIIMAYGRIDVYWPDGPIESYQLIKPSIGVGRSPGNDIVLDTTAVSRYHISLTLKDQQIVLEDLDSVNGTYVDGARVKPRDPLVLRGGEEIQLGDVRLVFKPEIDEDSLDVTRPIGIEPAPLDTRRIEIAQPAFKVELDPPGQPVTPGAFIQANVTITNLSTESQHYTIEVDGVPKEWLRLDRAQLDLEANEDGYIVINFKPLRRSETAPGDYKVTLRVISGSTPDQTADAVMTLRVRSYSGFGMVLGTPRIDIAKPFDLHLHNQGSGPLGLQLSGASPSENLLFDIQPSRVTLGPGEHRTIYGHIRAKQRQLLGRSHEHRFDILAHAQDASGFLAPVQGTFIEQPALPWWVPAVLVFFMVLLIAAGALGMLAIVSHAAPPSITSFTASAQKVFDGESVTLAWASSGATDVSLQIDNGQAVKVDPSATAYTQTMSGVGDHVLQLVAASGNQLAKQQLIVSVVAQALKVNAFTVNPNPLLKNVKQTVAITWNVDGAISISFLGLEALNGKPDDVGHPPTGTMTINAAPHGSVDLVLDAFANDGRELKQDVRIEAKDPVCKVTAASVDLHSAPDSAAPVTRSLASNGEVTPDGQDQSQLWVHLAPQAGTSGPAEWIVANALSCNGFATTALNLVIPTAPVATSTPAATASPAEGVTPTAPDTSAQTPTPLATSALVG